jgi:hypothetical protein
MQISPSVRRLRLVGVLHKQVEPVICAALQTLEIGYPSQVINTDGKAAVEGETVAKIPGAVADATVQHDVAIARIVDGVPRGYSPVFAGLEAEFRPPAAASDRRPLLRVDSLACAASKIAEIFCLDSEFSRASATEFQC